MSDIDSPEEVQIKRRGRPRKYESLQARIDANAKKQQSKRKELTKLKQQLIEEGHQNQFDLINELQLCAYDKEYIDSILSDLDKHKRKEN